MNFRLGVPRDPFAPPRAPPWTLSRQGTCGSKCHRIILRARASASRTLGSACTACRCSLGCHRCSHFYCSRRDYIWTNHIELLCSPSPPRCSRRDHPRCTRMIRRWRPPGTSRRGRCSQSWTPGLCRPRGSRGFLSPLAASIDALREPRYNLSLGNRSIPSVWTPPHTRALRTPGRDPDQDAADRRRLRRDQEDHRRRGAPRMMMVITLSP